MEAKIYFKHTTTSYIVYWRTKLTLLTFDQLKMLIYYILIWAQIADIKLQKFNNLIEQIYLLHETNKDHKSMWILKVTCDLTRHVEVTALSSSKEQHELEQFVYL